MGLHWLQGDLSSPSPRIPLHWAVAITVALALLPTFLLGKWSFPVWVSFIVWAEYFALGAKLGTWKVILPSLPFGAIVGGAAWISSAVALAPYLGGQGLLWALFLTSFVWITLLVYGLRWTQAFTVGVLAVFNGLTLFLAVYFTGSIPQVGPLANPYYVIWWACLWTILMAYFGWFLGWFNVVITFPRKPASE